MTAPAAIHDLLPGLSIEEQVSILKQHGRRHADPERLGLYREGEFVSVTNARDLLRQNVPVEWTLLPVYSANVNGRRLRGYILHRTANLTYDQLMTARRDLDDED